MSSPAGSGLPETPGARNTGAPEHFPAAVVAAVGDSLDALGIGYAQLDDQWTIAHVNATAEAITSSAPGALVGRNHWDAFPAMAGTEFERKYHQAVDTGQPVVFRAFYPAPLDVWVEIRAVPRNGILDAYFTDITAPVAAEDDARAGTMRPGGTTFHFVDDGIALALDRAREAAGDRDVRIAGGGATILEYVNAGLIDEFTIALSPVLFGSGIRLFEGVDAGRVALEPVRAEPTQRVTHLTYAIRER